MAPASQRVALQPAVGLPPRSSHTLTAPVAVVPHLPPPPLSRLCSWPSRPHTYRRRRPVRRLRRPLPPTPPPPSPRSPRRPRAADTPGALATVFAATNTAAAVADSTLYTSSGLHAAAASTFAATGRASEAIFLSSNTDAAADASASAPSVCVANDRTVVAAPSAATAAVSVASSLPRAPSGAPKPCASSTGASSSGATACGDAAGRRTTADASHALDTGTWADSFRRRCPHSRGGGSLG